MQRTAKGTTTPFKGEETGEGARLPRTQYTGLLMPTLPRGATPQKAQGDQNLGSQLEISRTRHRSCTDPREGHSPSGCGVRGETPMCAWGAKRLPRAGQVRRAPGSSCTSEGKGQRLQGVKYVKIQTLFCPLMPLGTLTKSHAHILLSHFCLPSLSRS